MPKPTRTRATTLPITGLTITGLAALATPLLAPAARAQTLTLGEIVVSATLVPTEANKVGATVNVLDKKKLDASANSSVADALTSVPGFVLRAKGGVGQQASFMLRGASQNYVGVEVDGIDVADPSGPQVAFDFGHLGTGGISRIEVLQGSQSALYGSSAIGGVIDITTRRATEPGLHQYVWVEMGGNKTLNGSYALTHKGANSDFAVTYSHQGTSGYPVWAGMPAYAKKMGYWSSRLSANGSVTLQNGIKLGFAGFAEANHGAYFPSAFTIAMDPTALAVQKSDTAGLRLYAEFDTGRVKNTLSAQSFRIWRHYNVTPALVGSMQDYTGTRFKLAYKGETQLNAKTRLVFGADSTLDKLGQGYTSMFYNPAPLSASRRINGAFSELSYAATDQLTVTAALRHDHDSRFGAANTWRLSAAWNPSADVTVRASAGTGYRAPSNYELFSPYGNTALRPEKSRSYDLGIEKRFGANSHIRATLFRLSTDNLIGFDMVSYSYAQVAGKVRRSGVEIDGATTLGKLTVRGSYTYTGHWTDNAATTGSWAIPPRHVVALDLSAPLTAKLTGGVTLTGAADRAGLPNYAVLGARLNWDLNQGTQAYLRVENLTDTKYQLVQDYAQPGRTVYVGLRKSF